MQKQVLLTGTTAHARTLTKYEEKSTAEKRCYGLMATPYSPSPLGHSGVKNEGVKSSLGKSRKVF